MSESTVVSFANLPLPIRAALGMIGIGGGAFLSYSLFKTPGIMFFLVGVMVVGLLLMIYALMLRYVQNRRVASFEKSVQHQSSSAPSALNEAKQIAQLDQMRGKFDSGIEAFRRAGKDLYSLPWYLLIGEPGSGKSEAMRRSGIGFPRLEGEGGDFLKGVGGTINMDWWLTNQAVVLDMAGRVVFEEVSAGASSEWETFLKLLKKHRSDCPINGVLLVIPAESLIKDTSEEMVSKAQKISYQINRVQRILDVRFPVFVMVTKCDLVTGFREFFEPLSGSEQQQMLGWSNPQPIDAAFHTEMTEQYLSTVVGRLLRRRQVLLHDPTPQRDLSDSRLDEVDALFKLPDGFSLLASMVKVYLQTIFVPSEWAAKPAFFRGIYFTSSLQEGAALDVELAKALGRPLKELPKDGIWKRERALFLRDLFLDKVFHEKGLVSRASNVVTQYRRRKIVLLGASAAAAAFLIFLTWFGWRSLDASVNQERDLWIYVADKIELKKPMPLLVLRSDRSGADYQGATPIRLPDDRAITLSELHAKLFDSVQKRLSVPMIFRLTRPLDANFDTKRREAFRVVFEQSLFQPVLNCVSLKLQNDREEWTPSATAALASLIRLHTVGGDADKRLPNQEDINSLFLYVLSDSDYASCVEKKEIQRFGDAIVWCYEPKTSGNGIWPPAWLPQETSLTTNSVIEKGVARFINHSIRSAGDMTSQLQDIKGLREKMQIALSERERKCSAAETELFAVLERNQEQLMKVRNFSNVASEWSDQVEALSNEVAKASELLSGFRQRAEKIPLCIGDNIVSNYYAHLAQASNHAYTVFASLRLPNSSSVKTNVTLVTDIEKWMEKDVKAIIVKPDANKIKELRDYESISRRFGEQVKAFSERSARYVFPTVPPQITSLKGTWKEQRASLRKMEFRVVNKALDQFCREINELCATCRSSSNSVAIVETLDMLSRFAQEGMSSAKDSNLRTSAIELLKRWSQLDESAVHARKEILLLEPYGFEHGYFVGLSEADDDYVIRFWRGLAVDALVALADEVGPAIQAQWKKLHDCRRFPLDIDLTKNPLTLQELKFAKQALDQVEKDFGLQRSDSGKTIGEGAKCDSAFIKDPLDRLTNPQAANKFEWLRAARKVAFLLPDGEKEFSEFTVSLVPAAEQERLTVECGRKKDESACVVFENHYVALKVDDERFARCRMGSADQLGKFVFPIQTFALSFYEYREGNELLPPIACPGGVPWSVLYLLLDRDAKRASDKKWFVPLRGKQEKKSFVLWLQIETGGIIIPTRKEWPQNPPE